MEINASGTRRKLLTRRLGTVALVGLYCLSLMGVSGLAMTSGSSSALARGRGGGGGGRSGGGGRRGGGAGRGGNRGARGGGRRGSGGRGGRGRRGRGIGIGIYDGYSYGDDDCWWSPRRARWICPYYD